MSFQRVNLENIKNMSGVLVGFKKFSQDSVKSQMKSMGSFDERYENQTLQRGGKNKFKPILRSQSRENTQEDE
jgi:hypothetical protein